ncbi:ParB N-terminal domain-containing protein [Rheinheimera hassiensis]|uniref:ParB N-terminal domain-containing protein n=1 Tax=Rheinheimera hassiensis TaxID=1193627 RepID=UPI001F054F58|nr:ParB N-terminal domain-containing protein [Rheinheimera hassiensis]
MNKPVNEFYQANRPSKSALILPGQGSGGTELISPVSGNKIKLSTTSIPADKVMSSIVKCRYNQRNIRYLSPAAVSDILPSIKEAKRNTMPVLAVKLSEGKFEIIAGIRRCYAVSITPDAVLEIQYANEMSDEDKQILAKTLDTYRDPSILDLGLTLLDYKHDVGEEAFSVRKAALEFRSNKTKVNDALRAATLPHELLSLFPALEFISRTFIRSVVASEVTFEDITNAIEGLKPVTLTDEELNDEEHEKILKLASSRLEKIILNRLASSKHSTNEPPSKVLPTWNDFAFRKGVKAKISSNKVTLTINSDIANSELGKQLLEMLKQG